MAKQQPGGRAGNGQEKYETDELSISTASYILYMERRAIVGVGVSVGHHVCVFLLYTKPLLEILLFSKCKLVLFSSRTLKR